MLIKDKVKGMRWGQRFKGHFINGIDKLGKGREKEGSILRPRFAV